ncbi:MAG TPA: cyclic nucleotide-binding domain-containing protein [Candidatus Dormibacteraeota bacterium]
MGLIKTAGPPPKQGLVSRLVEVLQPIGLRADRLGSTGLFAGLPWAEVEFAAGCVSEILVERGRRMTIQGQTSSMLWLILEGEALVSADARPLRVAGRGDMVGLHSMVYRVKSPETTIALSPIHAFEADRDQFDQLMQRSKIRLRLAEQAPILPIGTRMSTKRPGRAGRGVYPTAG